MIKGILKRLTRPKPAPRRPIDALIARRAQRLGNRDRKVAAAYERVQTILFRGHNDRDGHHPRRRL